MPIAIGWKERFFFIFFSLLLLLLLLLFFPFLRLCACCVCVSLECGLHSLYSGAISKRVTYCRHVMKHTRHIQSKLYIIKEIKKMLFFRVIFASEEFPMRTLCDCLKRIQFTCYCEYARWHANGLQNHVIQLWIEGGRGLACLSLFFERFIFVWRDQRIGKNSRNDHKTNAFCLEVQAIYIHSTAQTSEKTTTTTVREEK